jgi:hypothetical protein
VYSQYLFFDEVDEFFGKFVDVNIFALAKLIAQAQRVKDWCGLAKGVYADEEIDGMHRSSPSIYVSKSTAQGSGRAYQTRAAVLSPMSEIMQAWCVGMKKGWCLNVAK